jgi:hypothetical protein
VIVRQVRELSKLLDPCAHVVEWIVVHSITCPPAAERWQKESYPQPRGIEAIIGAMVLIFVGRMVGIIG